MSSSDVSHCRAGFSEQVLPVALDFVSRVPLQLVQQMLQSKHAAQAKQSPQSGKSRADGRAGQKQPSHHSSHAAEQLADELQVCGSHQPVCMLMCAQLASPM